MSPMSNRRVPFVLDTPDTDLDCHVPKHDPITRPFILHSTAIRHSGGFIGAQAASETILVMELAGGSIFMVGAGMLMSIVG